MKVKVNKGIMAILNFRCSPSPLTFTSRLKFTFRSFPVITLVVIGLSVLTKGVAALFGFDLPDQEAVDFLVKARGLRLLKLLVYVLIVAPAVEELLFRGILYRVPAWIFGKIPRCRNVARWVFAVISSIIFSASHYLTFGCVGVGLRGPDSAFFALFVFGMAQCWLYRRTGRVWCPMLNHALFNLVNVILAFLFALL